MGWKTNNNADCQLNKRCFKKKRCDLRVSPKKNNRKKWIRSHKLNPYNQNSTHLFGDETCCVCVGEGTLSSAPQTLEMAQRFIRRGVDVETNSSCRELFILHVKIQARTGTKVAILIFSSANWYKLTMLIEKVSVQPHLGLSPKYSQKKNIRLVFTPLGSSFYGLFGQWYLSPIPQETDLSRTNILKNHAVFSWRWWKNRRRCQTQLKEPEKATSLVSRLVLRVAWPFQQYEVAKNDQSDCKKLENKCQTIYVWYIYRTYIWVTLWVNVAEHTIHRLLGNKSKWKCWIFTLKLLLQFLWSYLFFFL